MVSHSSNTEHTPYTGREKGGWSWGHKVPEGYRQNHPFFGIRGFYYNFFHSEWGKFYYLKRLLTGTSKIFLGFLVFYYPLDGIYCDIRKFKRERAAALKNE